MPTPRGSVLVIDDDPLVSTAIVRILSGQHDVTVSNDSTAALGTLLEGGNFDVILCDVSMPGLSGTALYTRLRARRPALADRIVFMSGGILKDETSQFFETIPNDRLDKPFTVHSLRAMVWRFVAARVGIQG